MAVISNEISLIDGMSPVMKNVISSLKSTIALMHDVSKASASDFAKAEMAVQDAASAMDKYEKEASEAKNVQKDLNKSLGNGKGAIDSVTSSLKTLVAGYLGFQGVKSFVGWSDEMTQTNARLNMINDGLQTASELQDMIFKSAQNSRASYSQTADMVAKLSLRAGDIFKNNKETILFSETLNKMFAIAGATQAEQQSASLQLTQALGSGALRGEEFNAVFEAAPNVMGAVAKSMGVPIGGLRTMAAEGQITAKIVKDALLGATEDVNKQFELMPMTWGQIWTKTVNIIMKEALPLQKLFSDFFNSKELQNALNVIVSGLSVIVSTGFKVFDFLFKNWNTIIDVTFSVLMPLALIASSYKMLTIVMSAHAFVVKIMTAAQIGLNAAFAACPVFWVIAGLVALIATIYLAVEAYNSLADSSVNASEVIVGSIMTTLAVLGNAVGMVWNLLLDAGDFITDIFVGLFESLYNMVNDGTTNFVDKFLNALSTVGQAILSFVSVFGGVFDHLFGTNIKDFSDGIIKDLEKTKKERSGSEYVSFDEFRGLGRKKYGLDRIGYGDAYNSAKDVMGFFKGGVLGGSDPSKDLISDETKKILKEIEGSSKKTAKNTERFTLDERGLSLLTEYAKNEWHRTYNKMVNSTKINFSGPINQSTDVKAIAREVEGMMLDSYSSLVGA